jgi:hypothetical protein
MYCFRRRNCRLMQAARLPAAGCCTWYSLMLHVVWSWHTQMLLQHAAYVCGWHGLCTASPAAVRIVNTLIFCVSAANIISLMPVLCGPPASRRRGRICVCLCPHACIRGSRAPGRSACDSQANPRICQAVFFEARLLLTRLLLTQ